MESNGRLIVALDVPTAAAASRIVAAVGASGPTYKVGLRLYTAEGPGLIRDLVARGQKAFLDLKFHDIPNTVASATQEAAGLGVHMLTVHAAGGGKMLRAAVEAGERVNPEVKILAVTVLTSMAEDDLAQVGVKASILDQVTRLASLALSAGCHGVVASAKEAAALRREFGDKFLIVTPGVRPAGASHGDQARVVTPSEAMLAGATHIVVGRPIIEAADPGKVTREILAELNSADSRKAYSFS